MLKRFVTVFVVFLAACAPSAVAPTPGATLPPTATAIPTDTPTPAPTPTPLPTATLAPPPAQFDAGFDASLPYWSFVTANTAGAIAPELSGTSLVFELAQPEQWAYAIYAKQDYSAVQITASADLQADGLSSAGLVCGYDAKTGWFEFDIFSDHTYSVMFGQWLADGVAAYTRLRTDTSEFIAATSNEITLNCAGNLLSPSVNGTALSRVDVTRFGTTTGGIGLSASSFLVVPARIEFGKLSVSTP